MNLLAIDKATTEQRTLMAELNESMFDSLTSGIRLVADSGHGLGRQIMDKFNQLDQRFLMRIFTRNQQRQSDMKRLFEELVIADQLNNMYSSNNNINKPGVVNPAFTLSGEEDVVVNMEANGGVVGDSGISNGEVVRRGRGSPTATPPPLDLNFLVPMAQQHRRDGVWLFYPLADCPL